MSEETATASNAAAKEYDAAIKKLGDAIAGLTLKQAVDLKDYMKDAYGIEPAAGGAVMMAGPAGAGSGSDEPEEQTAFDVVLTSAGDKKIAVIKVVRELTGLGLKEAKELVDSAPKAIKEKLPREEAEKMKADLVEAGASVEIK